MALNWLTQIWDAQAPRKTRAGLLAEIADSFGQSPTFLAHFAREQFRAGKRREAQENLGRALELNPDHKLAAKYREEWGEHYLGE